MHLQEFFDNKASFSACDIDPELVRMAKEKNPAAVALGRLGGLKGGKSTSPAKQEAARRNGLKNKKKK